MGFYEDFLQTKILTVFNLLENKISQFTKLTVVQWFQFLKYNYIRMQNRNRFSKSTRLLFKPVPINEKTDKLRFY